MDPLTIGFILVAFVGMYFLMIRPASKRAKEQQNTLSAIQPGARVMLTSGIFGTVSHVGDKQMVVELAPECQVTVVKQAVAKVVGADEEEFEYDEPAGLASAELTEATVTDVPETAVAPEVAQPELGAEPEPASDPASDDPRSTQQER